MAAIAQSNLVTITINDRELQVPKGELIVESVKRVGLEIPIFCYHSRMKPVGMCRMCLVEVGFRQPDGSVRKMPKPQAGCTLPASDGMVIFTDTEAVHRDRKGVLEFLLINHPLDCPICDRGGECPLQNNTLFYGPSTSRFVEIKRHLPKAFPLSEYVTLDLERCIQCGRCVRFTEEISGDGELAFRFRGAQMTPSTFELRRFTSKFSGNVIEICPVGALTSAKYRFRARPWDLETRPAVCTVCSNGCNVWFDYRVNRVVRINGRTNEAVNEEWTCDRGKFGHDFYNASSRAQRVLVRDGDQRLVVSDWPTAYQQMQEAFLAEGARVGILAGHGLSNEDYFVLRRLANQRLKTPNLDARWTRQLPPTPPRVESTIASLESEAAMLVFGTNLADESPIVFLRVRKAWFRNGAKVIVAAPQDTDADSFAHEVLRYRPGTEVELAQALAHVASDGAVFPEASPEQASATTGVDAEKIRAAGALLREHHGAILATTNLYNAERGLEAADALAALADATEGALNVMALGTNEQGARELGIAPGEGGLDTHGILNAAAEGTLTALWLVGADPFALHHDAAWVERALENVPFLVVQEIAESKATPYASVVLPMTAPAEQDGTYTNVERRVQLMRAILPPKGDAKPVWRVAEEFDLRVAPRTPFFNAEEIMAAIAEAHPAFAPARYALLPTEGALLESEPTESDDLGSEAIE